MSDLRPGASTLVVELPSFSPPGAKRHFLAYAELLVREWERKRQQPSAKRAYSPNAWFRKEAYRVIIHYIEGKRTDIFRQVAIQDDQPRKAVEEAIKNPFKLGLLAILSDDSLLTRQERNSFGNQMLYAWAHDVPVDFLNAFLAVTGRPTEVVTKIKQRTAEPGFEHRFIASRLDG